jgi:PAS domain S-box-containing protein
VKESAGPDRLLQGERRVLELIATGAVLSEVLDALCRVIDAESGLQSSIFLLDHTGTRLQLAAAPNLPTTLRSAVASFPVTDTACGAAVRRRRQTISPDIAIDPLYAGYHEAAAADGIRAAWSTPFLSKHGDALGTFAVYSSRPGPPTDTQLLLVQRATHLASIAVERHRTETELRESEHRFSTAFYASPACCTISAFHDGHFMYVNDQYEATFGYSRAETIGRTALDLNLWANPEEQSELSRLLRDTGRARDFEAKGRTKSGAILDILVWMHRIQILSEECVLGITFDITRRKSAEEALAQSERLVKVVLDTLPVGVAVVDANGDILLSNQVSRRIWSSMIASGRERWANSKGWWHDTGRRIEPHEWASARALTSGETSLNEVIDIEAFDGVRRTIQNSVAPIRNVQGQVNCAVIVNEDITARIRAEQELNASFAQMRTLTGRLMTAQDDERRRIAELLHETTAQDLAALKMHLARLSRNTGTLSDEDREALDESIELAERSMTGVRTLSSLLYPPLLDEAGLLSALQWYGEGFSARSGVAVELDLPPTFERLPQDAETALFRIVQESLMNVHRHATSRSAVLRLRRNDHELTLEIQDRGRGISPERLAQLPSGGGAFGVGISGMRERMRQLDGSLEIESSEQGTIVRARLPLPVAMP